MGIDEIINSSIQVCFFAWNVPSPEQDESMVSDKLHLNYDDDEEEGKLVGRSHISIRKLFNDEMAKVSSAPRSSC